MLSIQLFSNKHSANIFKIGETNGAGDEKTREVTTAQYLQVKFMNSLSICK